MLGASSAAASAHEVQLLLRTLGVPADWDPPVAAEGILFGVLPEPQDLSMPLPATGCSFYSEQDSRRRAYRSLPILVESTLSTLLLRRHMTPALPIALAAPRSTAAFVRSRSELAGVWDLMVELDEAALPRAERLPLSSTSRPFLWKLAALLRAPFERSLFLDADVLALSRTFASDVLRNSLRVHDIAMPVDTGRPGNLNDDRTRVMARCQNRTSWLCRYWNRRSNADASELLALKRKAQQGTAAQMQLEDAGALEPPMFGRGQPPFCSCVMAFRRTPRVRRLFAHAAVRLAHRLNPTDLTDPAVGVRQTDQEMLWLELFTGPVEQQPSLLVLPEEYYCPAVAGTNQAIDIAARLRHGIRPTWGYVQRSADRAQGAFVPKEHLHYLSGGQKDCHAVHVHYALNRLRGWENITGDASQAATMHYALHLLDLEHYCWRRQAAGHRGCSVSRATKQMYPQGALTQGATDHPKMVRSWVSLLQQKASKRLAAIRLTHCASDAEAPTVRATLRLSEGDEAGGSGLAYLF